MKMELSINIIVVIALAVLVLAVVGIFFFTQSSGQFSRIEAERIFSDGCSSLCQDPCRSYYLIGPAREISNAAATEFHSRFFNACESLGYAAGNNINEKARACLNACADCDVDCEFSTDAIR